MLVKRPRSHDRMNGEVTKEDAQRTAVDFLKQLKSAEKVDVATVERNEEDWIIRGTCPIDMEGHPWAEKFEIVIDIKGKVKSLDCGLL